MTDETPYDEDGPTALAPPPEAVRAALQMAADTGGMLMIEQTRLRLERAWRSENIAIHNRQAALAAAARVWSGHAFTSAKVIDTAEQFLVWLEAPVSTQDGS